MSALMKKISLLSLALILSFILIGCTVDGGGLTQGEIDQIIDNVITAQYDTVKFDMDMSMTMEIEGGPDAGTMGITVDGDGVMDMINEEMKMVMSMSMDIPELGDQDMTAEVYIVGDWMYTKVDIPDLGEQWMKMKVTPEDWQQQNQIEPMLEFLATAVEVESLGSKVVNGTDCYGFEIVPDIEKLGELLSQQASGMAGMDLSQFDLSDIYKELSVKEWIAKDGYLLMKAEIEMVAEMSASDVGATEDDFENMSMDIEMVMSFHDYNEPVSIDLPDEALDAVEMPY